MMHPERVSMIRLALVSTFALGLSVGGAAGHAQAAETPRHVHKPARIKRSAEPAPTATTGGINAPSTDFSKIERGDADSSGPDGPTLRPSVGAGGMGLGGSF